MNLGEYIAGDNTLLLAHLNNNFTDDSGNGYDGTGSGTYSFVNGKIGTHSCDFTNGIVPFSKDINPTSNYTISFWMKPDSFGQSAYVLGKHQDSSGGTQWFVIFGVSNYGNNNVTLFYQASTAAKMEIPDLTNWHNVVYTNNGTNFYGYIDGKRIVSTGNVTLPDINVTFRIGKAFASAGSSRYTGKIDEVIVESRGWTAQEVQKYYTQALGRFNN